MAYWKLSMPFSDYYFYIFSFLINHNIMYMILIIIYSFELKFSLIVCLNSHYGFIQDCSNSTIILF